MELQKLKNKAAEAFAKGKFNRAAELYVEYCQKDPRDLQARIRMGDAWARTGKREKAILAYQSAAEGFAKDGFFPRAIAASKLILELDPLHKGVQQMLADLYAKKSGAPAEAQLPAPPPSTTPVFSRRNPAPSTRASSPSRGGNSRAVELPSVDGEELRVERTAADSLAGNETRSSAQLEPTVAQGVPQQSSSSVSSKASATSKPTPQQAVAAPTPAPAPSATPAPAPSAMPGPAPAAKPAPVSAATPVLSPEPKPAPAPSPAPERRAISAPISSATSPASASPAAAPAPAPAPGAAPERRATSAPISSAPSPASASPAAAQEDLDLEMDLASSAEAFTELELEGDSLLHAIERAARAGIAQRAQSAPPVDLPRSPAPTVAGVERQERIPKVPLFSDLAPEAFIELFERGPLLRFKNGERVFERGSIGRSFFVVCQGSVRVIREQDGTARELAVLPEGSFFGEMAILSDNPRIASVQSASDETELLEISAELLSELSKRHPQVAGALRKFCRQRLLINVMNTSALFRPFNKNDRRVLIERFRAREVSSAAAIIRQGEHSDGLYVILSGEVQVVKDQKVLAYLKEGDVFGEMSLLNKAPATATVSTTKRTSLLRLPREDFDELIMSHPQILVLVSELTDDRRRQTDAILGGAVAADEAGLILV